MKHYLNLIILICIFSCKTNNDHINETEFHDFSDIKIDFRTGDEVRTLSRMLILKDSQKIRAVKQSPFYYYGFQTDTIWTTEIGKSDLQLIKSFIIKARNQKDSCSFGSTSIDRYKISIGDSEELKIIGNCEWNNIDYDSLEHKIFQKQFEQLKLKREKVSDSITNCFIGKWAIYGLENGHNRGAKVTLARINETNKIDKNQKIWEFKKLYRDFLKKGLNIKSKSPSIELMGSRYLIINIKSDEIKLEYLF